MLKARETPYGATVIPNLPNGPTTPGGYDVQTFEDRVKAVVDAGIPSVAGSTVKEHGPAPTPTETLGQIIGTFLDKIVDHVVERVVDRVSTRVAELVLTELDAARPASPYTQIDTELLAGYSPSFDAKTLKEITWQYEWDWLRVGLAGAPNVRLVEGSNPWSAARVAVGQHELWIVGPMTRPYHYVITFGGGDPDLVRFGYARFAGAPREYTVTSQAEALALLKQLALDLTTHGHAT